MHCLIGSVMIDPFVRRAIFFSMFGANLKEPDSFALVGCAVAPGFEFNDLEIAERDILVALFPEHRQIIERLTR